MNLFGRQRLAAGNTVIRHRRSLKVGGTNNLCGRLERPYAYSKQSSTAPCAQFFGGAPRVVGLAHHPAGSHWGTALHGQADRELPVAWRPVAPPPMQRGACRDSISTAAHHPVLQHFSTLPKPSQHHPLTAQPFP